MYQQQRTVHLFNNRKNIFHRLRLPCIGKTMNFLWKPITQRDDKVACPAVIMSYYVGNHDVIEWMIVMDHELCIIRMAQIIFLFYPWKTDM